MYNTTPAKQRVAADVGRARQTIAATSLRAFTSLYLTAHCTCPFSSMHKELFPLLERMVDDEPRRLAVAAPRGHAKSTLTSLALPLWAALYGKAKFIVIVSATKEQAVGLLRHVREELTHNPLIQSDFPDIARKDGGKGSGNQPKPWRDNRITLSNGVVIAAYGALQGLRGMRAGANRPDLIIVDDLEDPEQVVSEEQREKLSLWFNGTLLHAGGPRTSVIVIGTILHHDALLAHLSEPGGSNGWNGRVYRAVNSWSDREDLWQEWAKVFRRDETVEYDDGSEADGPEAAEDYFDTFREEMLEGTEVLWPERESYYDLMVMREREGRIAFQAEKQNEPLDPEQCVFTQTPIRYWDDEFKDEESMLASLDSPLIIGACDPSLGKKNGDYSAIVLLAKCRKSKRCYVLVSDIARRSPDATIDRICHYHRMYGMSRLAVESNQFQSLLVKQLKDRLRQQSRRSVMVQAVDHRTNKEGRILSLEPELAQGRLIMARRHKLLEDQLMQFPVGKHDDGPDALEMAMSVALRYSGGCGRVNL